MRGLTLILHGLRGPPGANQWTVIAAIVVRCTGWPRRQLAAFVGGNLAGWADAGFSPNVHYDLATGSIWLGAHHVQALPCG